MVSVDEVDLALIHALQVDARASFALLADVLGVSDQTVARRYAALCRAEALTLSARRPVRDLSAQWLLRLTCTPSSARGIATSLATRADTHWVMTAAGGTEIVCLVDAAEDLLLVGLPRTPGVVSLRAHNPMRLFVGGPVAWPGRVGTLTVEQEERLRRPASLPDGRTTLDDVDERVVEALVRDPRAGYATIAHAAGVSEATARRRVESLRETGEVYFDVDVDPAVLGRGHVCLLFASVATRALPAVGAALARHEPIAMAAAITGEANLVAITLSRDPADLYGYLTESFALLDGVGAVESVPVHRVVKRSGRDRA